MLDELLPRWASTFDKDKLKSILAEREKRLRKGIWALYHEFKAGLPKDAQDDSLHDFDNALRLAFHSAMSATSEAFREAISQVSKGGRTGSRSLPVYVKDRLKPGYEKARREKGKGSLARMKVCFPSQWARIRPSTQDWP